VAALQRTEAAKTEGTPLNNALDQLLPPVYTAHPVMPAYTPLTPAQLDAARARSGNATQPLEVIRDPKGGLHEPLSLQVTRDVEYQLNLRSFQATHHIDRNIDRERNMVLADLLNAGAVKDWTVAQGGPDAATATHLQKAYDRQPGVPGHAQGA